jgi:hypothetical protein
MNLLTALQNISYDHTWGIWAEVSEPNEDGADGGLFENSPARYGQLHLENGGLLDGWIFVCHGEFPSDRLVDWCDGDDECDWDYNFTDQFLQEINESIEF